MKRHSNYTPRVIKRTSSSFSGGGKPFLPPNYGAQTGTTTTGVWRGAAAHGSGERATVGHGCSGRATVDHGRATAAAARLALPICDQCDDGRGGGRGRHSGCWLRKAQHADFAVCSGRPWRVVSTVARMRHSLEARHAVSRARWSPRHTAWRQSSARSSAFPRPVRDRTASGNLRHSRFPPPAEERTASVQFQGGPR